MDYDIDIYPIDKIERSSTRMKTFERTAIGCAGTAAIAHVLNVSETGAQVHSKLAVRQGDHVRVVIAGKEVPGAVVWAQDGRFGVRFSGDLDPDEIATLLR